MSSRRKMGGTITHLGHHLSKLPPFLDIDDEGHFQNRLSLNTVLWRLHDYYDLTFSMHDFRILNLGSWWLIPEALSINCMWPRIDVAKMCRRFVGIGIASFALLLAFRCR